MRKVNIYGKTNSLMSSEFLSTNVVGTRPVVQFSISNTNADYHQCAIFKVKKANDLRRLANLLNEAADEIEKE